MKKKKKFFNTEAAIIWTPPHPASTTKVKFNIQYFNISFNILPICFRKT